MDLVMNAEASLVVALFLNLKVKKSVCLKEFLVIAALFK